jgi:hypothetical protein
MPRAFVLPSRRHRTWPWTGYHYERYWTQYYCSQIATVAIKVANADSAQRPTRSALYGSILEYSREQCSQTAALANSSTRKQAVQSASRSRRSPHLELHARHQARHRCSHAIMQPSSHASPAIARSCLGHRDHCPTVIMFCAQGPSGSPGLPD